MGESRDDLGYGPPNQKTTDALKRIAEGLPPNDAAQQATNEQGATDARAQSPAHKREVVLRARLDAGQKLSSEEVQFLAQRRAAREK